MQTKMLADDRISKNMSRIEGVFIVFILSSALIIIFLCLLESGSKFLSEKYSQGKSLEERILTAFIALILFGALYEGLKFRKKWFIPLVLIYSATVLIGAFLRIFEPVADVRGLIVKVFIMIFAMFNLYLMYFFTRSEVKTYFGEKETNLF